MTAAAILGAQMAGEKATPLVIEDVRGYGAAVVARLRRAVEEHAPARPDPRHPHLFVIETERESFYVAPLPTGKLVLLAHWK